MVMPALEKMQCKVCGSHLTVRYGKIKGVQRWKCKLCGRNFLDNKARYHMKTPADQVAAAIRMHYDGLSLNFIRKQIEQELNYCPSISTVYKWIGKYSRTACARNQNCHPKVGDIWIADETSLVIDGKPVWIWDIIDKGTSFLLASHVSKNRGVRDIRALIEKALEKAAKTPKGIVADRLAPLLIEATSYPFKVEKSGREMAYFHSILQWRTDLMRYLKQFDKVVEFVDGWPIYYNYFRPQESLKGKTPSEVANIRFVTYQEGGELIEA
ncbi:MAG: DDE-type integrase/transposase/recombinase [Chloroflexota bacterium]